MSSSSSRRPSPAMVLAVIALMVALAGTAFAGPSPVDKLTKSKVKSIADKEIAKKAPTLSVDRAKTADTATNATNANTVGNKTAAQLTPSAAFDQSASFVPLAGPTVVASATITTSAPGQVLATGSADLFSAVPGDGNRGSCFIDIDGTTSPFYQTDLDDVGIANHATVAVNFARSLPAGSHTAALKCQNDGGNLTKDDAAISVVGINAP